VKEEESLMELIACIVFCVCFVVGIHHSCLVFTCSDDGLCC